MKRLIFILMALLSYGILRAETLKSPDGNIVCLLYTSDAADEL